MPAKTLPDFKPNGRNLRDTLTYRIVSVVYLSKKGEPLLNH